MASAYTDWIKAGKPLTPANPVDEIVDRLRIAYPKGEQANLFSYYANDAHYKAVPPEDHTPYSATGWPLVSPRWWVFATDVMHRPDLGVDCEVLFAYWIAEARAGRMPWLKYLNWQAKQYRAKGYGGETVAFQTAWKNSGHFDHIHLSVRTDHRDTSLGTWSLTPDGNQPVEVGMFYATCIEDEQVWCIDGGFRYLLGSGIGHKARDAAYGYPWNKDTPNAKISARLLRADIVSMAPVDITKGLPAGGGLVEHTHETEGTTGPAIVT